MARYVIEREIPGAGKLSPAELRVISKRSIGILAELGGEVRWLESFVVDDKMYCIYESPGTELIYEHARCLGIPATHVYEVRATIDPASID